MSTDTTTPVAEPFPAEDLPSNEELLRLAAETRDSFYDNLFNTLERMDREGLIPKGKIQVPPPSVDVKTVPERPKYGGLFGEMRFQVVVGQSPKEK
jgi:hypothetical protein